MPTYDYRCSGCGYEFEIFQGMLEKKLSTCPKCGATLKRLIGSGAGIVFKGNGFYQTDYRSSEYRKRAKEENTRTDSSPSGKPDSSSSGKPTPKTTTTDAAK